MAKRTDVHAPSNIIPSDYVFVAAITRDDALFGDLLNQQRRQIELHMEHTGGDYSKHRKGGNCHICGAHMIDYAVFYHPKSNAYIRTGFDCAAKLEYEDEDLFRRIRDERKAIEVSRAGKLKATGMLRERGLAEFAESLFEGGKIAEIVDTDYLETLTGRDRGQYESWLYTASDMVRNLVKYGEWSEKQWSYFAKLKNFIQNFAAEMKRREEERANAPVAPEGRIVVKGKVVTVKIDEGYYGVEHKMLVHAEGNFKVWCSVPKAITMVKRNDEIEMTITLTRSDKDHNFTIGKRPSNATITKVADE